MIYESIVSGTGKVKKLALLIDPDVTGPENLGLLLHNAERAGVSLILAGGSLVTRPVDPLLRKIKELSSIPVLLFPGNPNQLSNLADGLLLLSLISGRNPEFLIGNHVVAAHFLKNSSLEIIPTGYMLVENGRTSSAEYISNTRPIPRDKPDLAVCTAMAGEMLGLKLIYMEGGSGAKCLIPPEIISAVKKNIGIPLLVGGGIQSAADLKKIFDSGADIAVVGTAVEQNPAILSEFAEMLK
jgi:phosphoglycerol geranylgeranyltransferase